MFTNERRHEVAVEIDREVLRLSKLARDMGLRSWGVALASASEVQLSVAALGVDGLGEGLEAIRATTADSD